MEFWDAYDKDFNRVENVELLRDQIIPDGLFHLVCEIIVRHEDGDYLLMQRDYRKNHGGLWEATAGGSAFKGETPIQCARRELFEETGIRSNKLTELGTENDGKESIYFEFLCVTNVDKNAIVLQEGETIAYKWVSENDLYKMTNSQLASDRILGFLETYKIQNNEYLLDKVLRADQQFSE